MGLPLTKIEGCPDNSQIRPGMAAFYGTGPFGKTCGDCSHRGYSRPGRSERWDEKLEAFIRKARRHLGCEKFFRMTGKHGPVVEPEWSACKYFEPAPPPAK